MTECLLHHHVTGRGEVSIYCSGHHCPTPADGLCPGALAEKVRELEARIAKLEVQLVELARNLPPPMNQLMGD